MSQTRITTGQGNFAWILQAESLFFFCTLTGSNIAFDLQWSERRQASKHITHNITVVCKIKIKKYSLAKENPLSLDKFPGNNYTETVQCIKWEWIMNTICNDIWGTKRVHITSLITNHNFTVSRWPDKGLVYYLCSKITGFLMHILFWSSIQFN